jgi:hypothetical protein
MCGKQIRKGSGDKWQGESCSTQIRDITRTSPVQREAETGVSPEGFDQLQVSYLFSVTLERRIEWD